MLNSINYLENVKKKVSNNQNTGEQFQIEGIYTGKSLKYLKGQPFDITQ